eukprot:s4593_g4.t1
MNKVESKCNLKYPSLRGFCVSPMACAKMGTDDSPLEPRRISRSGYLCSADLDDALAAMDLHPHMMYGALMSSLDVLRQSIRDVFPAVVSVRLVLVLLLLPAFSIMFPLVVVERFLEISGMLIVVAEASFLVWLHRLRSRLNVVKPVVQRLQPAKALDIFQRTLIQVDQCAKWSEWLEGWFKKTPMSKIKRGNVQEFFAWAFYSKYLSELDAAEKHELEEMIKEWECERRYGWSFHEGYTSGVEPMRINFDPIQAWYHPLWYYDAWLLKMLCVAVETSVLHAAILGLRLATRSAMQLMGFTRCKTGQLSYYHRPPPAYPGLLVERGKPVPPSQDSPVVLIHGLGVGITPYLRFIRMLGRSRECFVIELPEVSQACCELEMADALHEMLKAHGHDKAVFLAHSYGTFVMSWVLQHIVARTVLLDPVALLLAQPDVAYNFLYRHPDNPMLKIVANFVRWELFSAHVLMRHFYWHHNVLWKEDLPPDSLVALGLKYGQVGSESILKAYWEILGAGNAHYIRRYLEDHQRYKFFGWKVFSTVAFSSVMRHGRVVLRGIRLVKALRLGKAAGAVAAASTSWANLGGFVGQAIAGSLLDDGDTTTAVATAAGGWAGGLAGSGVAAAAASTLGIEALGAGSVAGGLMVCGSLSAVGAVAGAGLAFAVKRLVADQAGAQADRTSEYYDCPLRLLGSADDDALLQ